MQAEREQDAFRKQAPSEWIETAKRPPTEADARYSNKTVQAFTPGYSSVGDRGVFSIAWEVLARDAKYYTHWRVLPDPPASEIAYKPRS